MSHEEFAQFYAHHFRLVWSALRRFGVREADVMDVTQKAFLVAYRKFATFEGRGHVRTWLFSICQRLASDYRRSAPIRREVPTEAGVMEVHAGAQDDASNVLSKRRRLALAEQLLEQLPEAQRVVFVLFELEELSGPEIAEMLELSVGTVRSRLRLARETFAHELRRLEHAGVTETEGT